jgi:hypothetical protein
MAEQKVKLTQLPEAVDTVDTAKLLINQNDTDQQLPVTHFLRAKNNLSELTNISQARANLDVPSVDEVNDKLNGFISGDNTFLAGASLASRTDYIWDEESKAWYYWKGTLPKEVPAASNPASTGGVVDGAWGEVGSDVLRKDLAKPTGAELVGAIDSDGNETTVQEVMNHYREMTIKDRLDVTLTTSAMGAIGDGVADDTAAIQQAIDTLAAMTKRGTLYIDGRSKVTTITIPATLSLQMIGNNHAGVSYNRSAIIGISTTGAVINCLGSACGFKDIQFIGSSNDAAGGGDTTQTAILFNPGATNSYNVDGHINGCGFVFFNKITDLRGRNLKLTDCIFSNSAYTIWIGTTGIPDFRGLDIQHCRFHYASASAGNETSPNAACAIYIAPNTNFFNVNVTNNLCDGCKWFFVGSAPWGVISNNHLNAQQTGALYIYSTGSTLGTIFQKTTVSNNVFTFTNSSLGATDGIYLVGGWGVDVCNNTINNAHRRAINNAVGNARINNNVIINPGFITSGFPAIESTGVNSSIIDNTLLYSPQGVGVPSVGIKIGNFTIVDGNRFINGFGGIEWDTSSKGATLVYGRMDISSLPSEEWGTAAPTSGRYIVGSKLWNISPAAGGTLGWVCVSSGTPGVWKGFGGIAA